MKHFALLLTFACLAATGCQMSANGGGDLVRSQFAPRPNIQRTAGSPNSLFGSLFGTDCCNTCGDTSCGGCETGTCDTGCDTGSCDSCDTGCPSGTCSPGRCGCGPLKGRLAGGRLAERLGAGSLRSPGCDTRSGINILDRLLGSKREVAPAPTGPVGYPYYTTRGPRDFLLANPPSIGPY